VFFGAISWRSVAQPAAGAVKATCGLRSAFIPPASAAKSKEAPGHSQIVVWLWLRRFSHGAAPA